MSTSRVLIVDDDVGACEFLADALGAEGFATTWTVDPKDAVALVSSGEPDAVVTDLRMPKISGLELCKQLVERSPTVPVVVATAFGSVDAAVEAMRAGAYDFVMKPFDVQAVVMTLRRAIEHFRLRKEVEQLRETVNLSAQCGPLLGNSTAMRAVYDVVSRVATSDAPVLVTGETGTGKELVARELHRLGKRRKGPFVAINCAALPEALLESELFGHVRGAFTDARASRDGLFVLANGGTIFLDEIADLPLGLQPKLLRVLQERTVRPIGGGTEVAFDAQIVSATNRDLESAIADRAFREDLYYRINVFHVTLPALRARAGDVLLLAQTFLERHRKQRPDAASDISAEAAEKLSAYDWPGNVRELANCIEHAVALCRTQSINVEDLPTRVRSFQSNHVLVTGQNPDELAPLEEVERRYILRVVDICQGNKSEAASVLGMNRKTLYRRLESYGRRE